MVDKQELNELVGIFYPSVYKTFYVNSYDGENFIKPTGVFISLGLTTSPKVLSNIKEVISSSNLGYNAEVAEICSRKVSTQFTNRISNLENPQQYKLTEFPDGILDKDSAYKLLEEYSEYVKADKDLELIKEYALKVSSLRIAISRLDSIPDGWENHCLLGEEDRFRIYHKFVNYRKEDDVEYRIGIYVSERN